jgi:hypothetical protein
VESEPRQSYTLCVCTQCGLSNANPSSLDDFFVGIGDINSAHIPRPKELAELAGATPPALAGKGTPTASAMPAPAVSAPAIAEPAPAEPAPAEPATAESAPAEPAPSATPALAEPPLAQPPPTVDPAVLTTPLSSAATVPTSDEVKDAHAEAVAEETIRVLDQQVADRPLAKKQEELAEKGTVDGSPIAADNGSATPPQSTSAVTAPASSTEEKPARKALLTNNDHELDRVQRVSMQSPLLYAYPNETGRYWTRYTALSSKPSTSERRTATGI